MSQNIDSLTNEIEAKFPILFNNIDGAASNFDSFTTELGLCRTKVLIIGIADTNFDEEHGKLYNVPGYKPMKHNFFSMKHKITNLHKPVYFGVVYRPPSAESIGKYFAEFVAYCLNMFTYLETITLTSLVVVQN